MEVYILSLIAFQIFFMPVIFFSILYFTIAISSLFVKNQNTKFRSKKIKGWPFVTIEIPVFNDPVAVKCIEKCLNFDYPKDRFEIVVADDSNDNITNKILQEYVKKFKHKIKVVKRNTRKGFKAGALNSALKYSLGEIIVIFDSDFLPSRNFLKRIVLPFLHDDKIVMVQSRMGFLNFHQNIISKFAATLLMVFHHIIMPINSKVGTVFFCGSGGAIRKSVLEKMGGWNENSLTEDADLSVRIMQNKYKQLYIPNLTVAGEVPFTLKSFLKQQMRWTFGTTRVFLDYWKKILFGNLSFLQKFMISFITIGYVITPFVVAATISGQIAFLTAPYRPINLDDILTILRNLLVSSGFLFTAILVIHRKVKYLDKLKIIFAVFFIGLILTFTNMFAFLKALFGRKMIWFKTPKQGNITILEIFRRLFLKL